MSNQPTIQVQVPKEAIPGTTILQVNAGNAGMIQVQVPASAIPGETILTVQIPSTATNNTNNYGAPQPINPNMNYALAPSTMNSGNGMPLTQAVISAQGLCIPEIHMTMLPSGSTYIVTSACNELHVSDPSGQQGLVVTRQPRAIIMLDINGQEVGRLCKTGLANCSDPTFTLYTLSGEYSTVAWGHSQWIFVDGMQNTVLAYKRQACSNQLEVVADFSRILPTVVVAMSVFLAKIR
jgi:hypothetical protein